MSTARSNRCRAPAFCNWSNGNERRCRDPRCRGDGIDPLTLNQRVQGSSPCAPTIKSITRDHSRGIKLERFAFVPTLALYVLVLFGGSGKLDRRGGGMLPARARAAP